MPPTRALKVFLCHASADKPAVRKLYRYLKDRKIDAWLDAEKLMAGQSWRDEIPKAIKNSDAIIVCLSKNSINKEGYIQKEIKFALDKAGEVPSGRIFLIPAKLEECSAPDDLSNYHWVNLFEEDGYRRLMRSLRARSEQIDSVIQISDSLQEQNNLLDEEERGKSEHESADKAAKEKTDRERIERELAKERDFAQKAEREGVEKAAKEKAERQAVEKAGRNKAEREAAFKAAQNFLQKLKTPTLVLLFAFIGYLLWQGIASIASIPVYPAEIETPQVTFTAIPPTKTITPAPTKTLIPTSIPTLGVGSTMLGTDGATLVYVPEGEFTMGSNNGSLDEKPVHIVNLDAFWIDQTEVTNAMYAKCVNDAACTEPSNISSATYSIYYGNSEFDNYPVLYVDWIMAKTYCEYTGRRLPTEAEWEKAARGTDERIYPWGNDFNGNFVNFCDVNCPLGWTTKGFDDGYFDTAPVKNYPNGISPYGAYDMAGNVWEWVNDWYSATYYQISPSSNPLGPDSGEYRGMRGGSLAGNDEYLRTTNRGKSRLNYDFGFRCVRSP